MGDLEWAVNDDYSAGGPTKVEPGSGVKAEGQSNTTASVSAQELNWHLHELSVRQNRQREQNLKNALRFTLLNPGLTQKGVCVHDYGGTLIAVESGGAWTAVPLCMPGTSLSMGSGTLTGTPAFGSGVESAPSTNPSVAYNVFVFGGYAYRVSHTLSAPGRYALADIVSAKGIVWSDYGSQFIAIGTDGSSNGTIEVSGGGNSWAEVASGQSTNNTYNRIASDPTGQYVLAGPSAGDDWAYSEDGGASWTVVTIAVDGDSSFTVEDLCYDAENAQWLACLSSFSGDATHLWYSTDPTSGWSDGGAVGSSGLQGEAIVSVTGIITVEDYWLAAINSANFAQFALSKDQGTTWRGVGSPIDEASAVPMSFRRSGDYILVVDNTDVPTHISGAVYA